MNKSILFISWIILSSLSLSSCGSVIKLISDVPNFRVYSNEQINESVYDLGTKDNVIDVFPSDNSKEDEIKSFLYMSILYSPYVFDKNNNLLCSISDDQCVISNLAEIKLKTISESFVICDTISFSHNILRYFKSFENLFSKTSIETNMKFKNCDYKILYFINSDVSKNELKTDWENIYNSFNSQNQNVAFVRIWTDLNENWGLKKNAKVRTKVKKVKGQKREYELFIGRLPLKNNS